MNWKRRSQDLPPARKSSLALKADEKASFGIIIKVMDALKLAGVKNLPAFTQRREMKLPIVRYGDPVLRAKGKRVADGRRTHPRTRRRHDRDDARWPTASGSPRSRSAKRCNSPCSTFREAEDRPSTMKLNGAEVDPKRRCRWFC